MTFHFTPRLMKTEAAAHYLGISASKLRSLDLPRRMSGANRLYDVHDLDSYVNDLPYEGEQTEDWEAAFE